MSTNSHAVIESKRLSMAFWGAAGLWQFLIALNNILYLLDISSFRYLRSLISLILSEPFINVQRYQLFVLNVSYMYPEYYWFRPVIALAIGLLCIAVFVAMGIPASSQKLKHPTFVLCLILLGFMAFSLSAIPGILAFVGAVIDYYGMNGQKLSIHSSNVSNISIPNNRIHLDMKSLEELGNLKKAGILTEEEFQSEKKKLM